MEPIFALEVRHAGNGVVHVVLTGELDIAGVGEVKARVAELAEPGRCLVLDMSGLTFIDSTGIEMLVRTNSASARDGWKLALVPGPPNVQSLLRLLGLEDHLPFMRAESQPPAPAGAQR